MIGYLDKKHQKIFDMGTEKPLPVAKGFVLLNDYSVLWQNLKGKNPVIFLDDFKWVYSRNSSYKDSVFFLSNLEIVLESLKLLFIKDCPFDSVVIDSTDFMYGDIVPVYEFCVKYVLDMFFVLGSTQFGSKFFRYNAFFQNTLNEVLGGV